MAWIGRHILFACLLASAPAAWAEGGRCFAGFSQTSFPDVSIQDVKASLAVWGDEIARNIIGLSSVGTNVYARPEEIATAMQKAELDIAILPTYDYFRLEPRMNAEIGFVVDQGDAGRCRYLLVVGPSQTASALRKLKGVRFCRARLDSMGLLYLNNALLRDVHQEMDRFFASVETLPRGAQALNSVYFGKTDACLVTEESYRLAVAMNPQMARRLRIIDTSPDFYASLAIYRKDYSLAMRRKLESALGTLQNYTRGRQLLNLFNASGGIRTVTEADLAETRRVYREYRQRKGKLL